MPSRRITVGRYSRYQWTKSFRSTTEGVSYMGIWNRPTIAPSDRDVHIVITSTDIGRLDMVATTFYKTPVLWWLIADANSIFDPWVDMRIGGFLRIPDPGAVVQLFPQLTEGGD